MAIRALLIDDEEHNIENLKILLGKYCPSVEVVGVAQNMGAALKEIERTDPDVLFLDIEMPKDDGFSLLKNIGGNRKFEVIFVTAYNQYALKAIKFSALDYILKPIKIHELQAAVKKLLEKREEKSHQYRLENMMGNFNRRNQEKKLAIATAQQIHCVSLSDIVFCQSDNNYTNFKLTNGQVILASNTLKMYERILNDFEFLRIHHSFLINLRHVDSIVRKDGSHVLFTNGDMVPFKSQMKKELLKALEVINR